MASPSPLDHVRVVDFSSGIAGSYCTKLFADAGADVIRVEPPDGDPLRRWSATRGVLTDEDAPLFQFLHQGKRSVTGSLEDPETLDLVSGADLVVESFEPGVIETHDLPARFPNLVVCSISPYGHQGPWAHRPWTEFTIQAQCGSIGTRGLPGEEPFQAGGRTTEWLSGPFAAVAALAAVHRSLRTGHGEHVDFSIFECMTLAGTNYMDLFFRLMGVEAAGGLPQSVETPSVEPTADGYVGFCTNSRQQFSDFLLLIERPDLQDDEALAQVGGRTGRFHEWNEIVHAFTKQHTTQEITERASLLRIPVAPVLNGDTVRRHEQLVARGVFRQDPTGRFQHPRRPYRLDDEDPPPARPAPAAGEHTGRIEPRVRERARAVGNPELPLAGIRVVDMTAWWAGPSATHMLAALGADVIHLESTRRPDGMRMVGGMMRHRFEDWWECAHFYLGANTNKRGLTLDLSDRRGLELARRLVAASDALVENFSPRVLDGFGLTWETIHAANPRTILVRMPAFGLSGPWRDNVGFAQTMEQVTGLAWLTGHRDDQPRIQRGPCDPLSGMHAAYALLVTLAERERTGVGRHVECTMVEGALNAASEQLIELTAFGNLMHREGNRCPEAAPQGLYPCAESASGEKQWLALSVANDDQWRALVALLDRPAWAGDAVLAIHKGRRERHDRIDAELRPIFAARDREKWVDELLAAGVPAAPVADPRLASRSPQHVARGFYEEARHPVVGVMPYPTVPFRYAGVDHWIHRAAPTLGQHNREILGDLLGIGAEELDSLEKDGVIGSRPQGL